ncbi:MAG: EAL domain-containing protein [Pseudomonadota bacterium]
MGQSHDNTTRFLEDFAEIASDWFWETDAEHRFTFFSSRVEDVLKVNISDLIGRRRDQLAAGNTTDPKFAAHVATIRAHKPFRNFQYSVQRANDAAPLYVRTSGIPMFDEDGTFTGYRGVGADMTAEYVAIQNLKKNNALLADRNRELVETRRALERSMNSDHLTGLLNRRAFERDIEEALGVAGATVILLHIDLDRFKWVNDTLGYAAGDVVLVTMAERLRTHAGGVGPVYRVGGDEFIIAMADNADAHRARWIADAIIEAMEDPVCIERQAVSVSASIGIASGVGGRTSMRQLVTNADMAIHYAKSAGRRCVQELTPRLLAEMEARRALASELPGAIDDGQIVPFFQPQIDARTGEVIGAEALARWNHPKLGILPPVAFLDIATEMGLIPAIDRSMMQQALQITSTAIANGHVLPAVSVNLSAGRLMDQNLLADIRTHWTDHKCLLAIELLETISLDGFSDDTAVSHNLAGLRDLGVRIETDDFGSGRASITSLLHVRPDRVKIDRHLIQSAVSDPTKRQVVSAIMDMARSLEIEVLAEGVETEEDVEIIRGLGCQLFQGYAFSAPLDADAFLAFLPRSKPAPKMKMAGQRGLPKHA